MFRYILKKYGHVSSERILSGPGIKNIYDFLRDTKKAEEPAWLKEQMDKAHDAPALISQMAQDNKAPICDQTMSVFVSAYGAKTGDYALNFMSTGGIFVCGIIAARNLSKMKDPIFIESFLSKGRLRGLLEDMPVKIVLNDDCGIMGAARYTLIQKAFGRSSRARADAKAVKRRKNAVVNCFRTFLPPFGACSFSNVHPGLTPRAAFFRGWEYPGEAPASTTKKASLCNGSLRRLKELGYTIQWNPEPGWTVVEFVSELVDGLVQDVRIQHQGQLIPPAGNDRAVPHKTEIGLEKSG